MSTGSKVYVVGTPEGAKANSYEAMTNSMAEAAKLAAEMKPEGVIKEVSVPPKRGKR